MNFRNLERRDDPRIQSFLPVTLLVEGSEQETPAQLLDLSIGGAAILTTAYNAPELGHQLNLFFDSPNNDGGSEKSQRRENCVVVNSSSPERGIRRVGVRFYQRPDLPLIPPDPSDSLSGHRMTGDAVRPSRSWSTARNFRTPAQEYSGSGLPN